MEQEGTKHWEGGCGVMDKTCSACEYSTENKHGGLLCLHPKIVASGIVLPVCVDDVCVDWKEDTQ